MTMSDKPDYFFIHDFVADKVFSTRPTDWIYAKGARQIDSISLRFGRYVADYCKGHTITLPKARYTDPVTGFKTGLMRVIPCARLPLVERLWREWAQQHPGYFED